MGQAVDDFKYGDAVRFEMRYLDSIDTIKTDKLKTAAEIFRQNIKRVHSLVLLPPGLVMFYCAFQGLRTQANWLSLQQWESPTDPEKLATVRAREKKITKEWNAANPGKLPGITGNAACNNVSSLAMLKGSQAAIGVEALLHAVPLGAWTAFEVLAGDLWKEAVNHSPSGLATLTGKVDRIEKKSAGEWKETQPNEGAKSADAFTNETAEKIVSLGMVHKVTGGSYNLSKVMGELLVASKRVKFTSLTDIREAYSLAFSEKCKKMKPDAIDAALANQSLDLLSLVRNLLVHKGGQADSVYEKDSKNIPNAPKLGFRGKIQIDGKFASDLVNPAIRCGVDLLKAVDRWLEVTSKRRAEK